MQTTFLFGNKQQPSPPPAAGRSLEESLKRYFGFDRFRHGQPQLIEALLAGQDALGVMPTGGGKSLCFQLPSLLLPGMAVVASPLIALMKDQVDALRARGIAADYYNSTLSSDERRTVLERVFNGGTKILYIAPERVQSEGFIQRLAELRISLFAVDEAHCISQWGHDFRPDYMRLREMRQMLGNPPCIALTATATRRVQLDIIDRLGLREPRHVVTGFHRPNLTFEVRRCGTRNEKLRALKGLIATAERDRGSSIIYAATRKHVEWLATALRGVGVPAGYYHAGMSDEDREEVQEHFRLDRFRVLVATNAFGMGIDKPDIRLVAHFDIPGSMEAYYQEAGRAGRDGRPARCALLFNHADVATQEFFIDKKRSDSDTAESLLKQLVRYAYAKTCRQHLILDYFGDEEARSLQHCGHCDICVKVETEQPELEAAPARLQEGGREALACVGQLGGRLGKTRVAETLKGSNTAAVRQMGLTRQEAYGKLRAWPMDEIKRLIDSLVEGGYLAVNGLEYPVLGLTERGRTATLDGEPLRLPKV